MKVAGVGVSCTHLVYECESKLLTPDFASVRCSHRAMRHSSVLIYFCGCVSSDYSAFISFKMEERGKLISMLFF